MPSRSMKMFDSNAHAKQRFTDLKNIFLQVHDSIHLAAHPQLKMKFGDNINVDDLPFPLRVKKKLHHVLSSKEVRES